MLLVAGERDLIEGSRYEWDEGVAEPWELATTS